MCVKSLVKKVSKVRGWIKTIDNILFPECEQTQDNAYSEENAFENKTLTEEFEKIRKNQQTSICLLKEYCYIKAIDDEGLLLTEKDKKQRAEEFYNALLDCNFINKGLLSRHIIDEIKTVVNKY